MSTYLELCQDTARECDVSGGDTVPTTVTGQTGELQRIVKWVAQAYVEIQNRHTNWRWMRHEFTLNTVADDDSYTFGDCTDQTTSLAITRFSHWAVNDEEDPPRVYLTSSGVGTQTYMVYIPWEQFKQIYRLGSQTSQYPIHITIDPQNNLVVGAKPNGIYTITSDYYRSAQNLSADDDTPEMPSQFHQLIVYRAMQKFGFFESAPEVESRGQVDGDMLMRQLEVNQLPSIRISGPMA